VGVGRMHEYMDRIPSFAEAVEALRNFLRADRQPDEIVWAFRVDVYSISPSEYRVAWPLPPNNVILARRLFDAGRHRGLVELQALFNVWSYTVVNVFAPLPDEIQGWTSGLKLVVCQPFIPATPVARGLRWWMHTLSPAYSRFQHYQDFISRRNTTARGTPSNPWVEKDSPEGASHPKR
jgi:hypothetical protein